MEKFNDKQKRVADDELEQVSGGIKLWDAVTTEFNSFLDQPKAKMLPMDDEEDNAPFGAKTLEMRVKRKRRKGEQEDPKVIKL